MNRGAGAPALFVPESVDRIQVRRFPRGVDPEDDSDDRTDRETDRRPIERDDGGNAQEDRGDIAAGNPQDNPDDPAELAEDDGFEDELGQDIVAARADGLPDADFARPFGHRDEHG